MMTSPRAKPNVALSVFADALEAVSLAERLVVLGPEPTLFGALIERPSLFAVQPAR